MMHDSFSSVLHKGCITDVVEVEYDSFAVRWNLGSRVFVKSSTTQQSQGQERARLPLDPEGQGTMNQPFLSQGMSQERAIPSRDRKRITGLTAG
jgi:hypothetical protein